jgi:lipoprotein-anchoring transpeptidase ErfK/SrfK
MLRRPILVLAFLALCIGPSTATAFAAAAPGCQYVLGFKALHDAIPQVVGDCLDNEAADAAGNHVQHSANGVLVWRKADNLSAFTDGQQTWVAGPFGVQARANDTTFPWEAKAPDAPSTKAIYLSLSQQALFAYQDGQLIVQAPITSGGPRTPTPLGTFTVLQKRSHFIMKSPWPQEDPRWYPDSFVNYALLFERSGYFVHDAPWRSSYGPGTNFSFNPEVGWVGTHGCVNVPFDAEQKLFDWADIGTQVTVLA